MGGKLAGLFFAVALTAARYVVAAGPVPERVIIDTDVGDDIDDAFALAIALHDPRLQVIGITTAWGDTWTRTLLVRRLLATLGRKDVVVAQGPSSNAPFAAATARFTSSAFASGTWAITSSVEGS